MRKNEPEKMYFDMDIPNETVWPKLPESLILDTLHSKIDIMEPNPNDISIDDVITGLSNKGHYMGQSPRYFSIAEHCILSSAIAFKYTGRADIAFLMLFHDSEEFLLWDVASNAKCLMHPDWKNIKTKLNLAIMQKVCEVTGLNYIKLNTLRYSKRKTIKFFDNLTLAIEHNYFFNYKQTNFINPEYMEKKFPNDSLGILIEYLSPAEAKNDFYSIMNSLIKQIAKNYV